MSVRLSHGWQMHVILALDPNRPGVAAWCTVLRGILGPISVHWESWLLWFRDERGQHVPCLIYFLLWAPCLAWPGGSAGREPVWVGWFGEVFQVALGQSRTRERHLSESAKLGNGAEGPWRVVSGAVTVPTTFPEGWRRNELLSLAWSYQLALRPLEKL